jgi:curli biogenesis system outer membrane secretion channel CsgG
MHSLRAAAIALAALLAHTGGHAQSEQPRGYEPPQVDAGRQDRAFSNLPPRAVADRVAVSIYEFRSSVTEIPPRATTDMFKTALVRSGQFRVVERARVAEGVMREKQLNAAGLADGTSAAQPLRAAKYVFEGTISEATPSQSQRSGAVIIAGMEAGGGSNRDVISIDVRVLEVASGDIVDVVTVRKPIASETSSVAGVGNLIGTVLSQRGRSTTYVPDVQMQQQRRESLDQALREAIDQAVATLALRLAR